MTLTAVPAAGWGFREWTGAAVGGALSANVTMTADKSVNAIFEQLQLTVSKVGEGTVTPPGGGETLPHTITYGSPQTVGLTASPAVGWGFKEWTGDASGENPSTSVVVDGSRAVTAVFAQVELTVDKEGEGTVSVSPPGGAQTLPYTGTYGIHESVNLSANPANCWYFKRWEGGPTGENASASVQLDTDMTVKAVFGFGPLTFVEPDGHPVTDNHYVFQSSVCTVNPEVAISGGGSCELDWHLESIQGSTLGVTPDPPNSLTPVFTYSGLPASNDEFGDKTLSVSDPQGVDPKETTVQIFFALHGNDHPDIPASELEDWLYTPTAGSGSIPNWYYYWKQTTASFGTHVLDNSSRTNPPWMADGNVVRVGADGSPGSPSADWYNYNLTERNWTVGRPELPGGQKALIWESQGIDTFAFICRHEAMHVTVNNELWPTGQRNVSEKDANGNVIGDYNQDGYTDAYDEYLDLDFDWFPDAREPEFGYDPTKVDTNAPSGLTQRALDMSDYHDYVIWRQITDTPWLPGSADSEDWASPGAQSSE